ncbi:hypothetical protein [Halorubrum vacuolatum]|uniref:Uncharacterized protein n=1 Tax=Halorubrum vacuolatum TaxID=63740 RepID=A0A238UN56_HALVU|nr:hypothetical protein [Halorubrum vacuolatum]SNR23485.1 hypothetical protein SAMN06264855_101126 [Halorubrum vacuolatum]
MHRRFVYAIRGIAAGMAMLSFVLAFLLFQMRVLSTTWLLLLLVVGVVGTVVSLGPMSLGHRFSGDGNESVNEPDRDAGGWWLAAVASLLEERWNTWSDLVLVLGFGSIGVGSFVALAVHPGDDPPFGLVIIGFFCLTCALVGLAFVGEND